MDTTTCPKCGCISGNDWRQCKGSCPMSGSPHYAPAAPSEPVATVRDMDVSGSRVKYLEWTGGEWAPVGTTLYTTPQPSAKPAGAGEAPDGAHEALQRMIEDGMSKGPASRDDALLVAKYRRPLLTQRCVDVPTTPAATAGLTDAEILAAGKKADCVWLVKEYSVSMLAFARAILASTPAEALVPGAAKHIDKLPPLPAPFETVYDHEGKEDVPCYSPTQMEGYARQAITLAAPPAAQGAPVMAEALHSCVRYLVARDNLGELAIKKARAALAAAPAVVGLEPAHAVSEEKLERDHGPYPESAPISQRLMWWIPNDAKHGKTLIESDISEAADELAVMAEAVGLTETEALAHAKSWGAVERYPRSDGTGHEDRVTFDSARRLIGFLAAATQTRKDPQ